MMMIMIIEFIILHTFKNKQIYIQFSYQKRNANVVFPYKFYRKVSGIINENIVEKLREIITSTPPVFCALRTTDNPWKM